MTREDIKKESIDRIEKVKLEANELIAFLEYKKNRYESQTLPSLFLAEHIMLARKAIAEMDTALAAL